MGFFDNVPILRKIFGETDNTPREISTADGNYDFGLDWPCPEIDTSISLEKSEWGSKKGDPKAQCELSLRYLTGQGVTPDAYKALDLCMQSASQNNAKALYLLAYIVRDFGDVANIPLLQSAELGYIYAQARMGAEKYTAGDIEQSFQWHLKAAKQGCAESCYECGAFLLGNQGIPQDLKQAVYWLRKAAEQDVMRAQFELGVCYNAGEGVKQDFKEALKWLLKSAEQGHPRSLYGVGIMYLNGQGTEQDIEKGIDFIVQAAQLGNPEAQQLLQQLEEQNQDEQ